MHPVKEYKGKIRKLEKENQAQREKILAQREKQKSLQQENNYLRHREKELTKSRDSWKSKHKDKQVKIKLLSSKLKRQGKAKRHHYASWLVSLCVELRIHCGCSYAGICKILMILQVCLKLRLEQLPCANSIQNWVSKTGLYALESAAAQPVKQPVGLIIDESIRQGREKLLLILAVGWQKQKEGALSFQDAQVVYMKGLESCSGEIVSEAIEELKQQPGFEVRYLLSDEDSKLKKAARLSGLTHLPDISHAMASCLRKTFEKEADYKAFTKQVSDYQSRSLNQQLSYLRPPKQRSKARFMNQQAVVSWAQKLLSRFDRLTEKEQNFFRDLAAHQPVTAALAACLALAKQISLPFKTSGLSAQTLKAARQLIEKADKEDAYLSTFLTEVEKYLLIYQQFIEEHVTPVVHISSEIIESLFGKYKSKANNYALTGLTNLNLEIPLYCIQHQELLKLIPEALESIFMTALDTWRKEHSADNQLIKRIKFFKNTA